MRGWKLPKKKLGQGNGGDLESRYIS